MRNKVDTLFYYNSLLEKNVCTDDRIFALNGTVIGIGSSPCAD